MIAAAGLTRFTRCSAAAPRGARAWRAIAHAAGALVLAAGARPAGAQTDYYNTDAGRPVRVEDAYPVEHRAVELQFAPLRIERARGGVYRWGLEPEVAAGLLPRTQFELGAPLAVVDAGPAGRTSGLAGVELSVLYNLNAETAIPALGVAADVLLPAGHLGPERAYASVTGIVTRTLTWARFHVNAQYTFGEAPGAAAAADAGAVEVSRWLAGVAVDRAFPLRALLVTAETYAQQPIHREADVEWTVGGGMRYQLSPRWALDLGAGRRVTGDAPAWYATVGSAYAVGLPWRGR